MTLYQATLWGLTMRQRLELCELARSWGVHYDDGDIDPTSQDSTTGATS